MKPVAIIGGGITGLTVAFRLQEQNVPVTLYEAGSRLGGPIQTFRQDGYLAEFGPNTILETSPRIASLIRDVGIESRQLASNPAAEKRFLVRGGQLVALPGSPGGFLTTPLFSARAKLRLLAEPFIRRARPCCEESVADFVVRRIGREFLDYAINPFVAGVYAGDPARLSVRHAFPRLHALEQRYGSLILGQILGARERRRRAEVSKQQARKLSFDGGLQVLIDALRERLGNAVKLRSPVLRLERREGGWEVTAGDGAGESAQPYAAVLFAGTAHALAGLQLPAGLDLDAGLLNRVHYPPVASVVLGFRREDVRHPLDGFGVLIPQIEGFNILGTIFSSSLFPGRAPAGHVTLTSYVGGARQPELALLESKPMVEMVCQDLQRLLGVQGPVTFQHHVLFRKAIPQYEVGYGRVLDQFTQLESRAPGLFLAGHYRNGISLGDSIVAGHDVAARITHYLAGLPTDCHRAERNMSAQISA